MFAKLIAGVLTLCGRAQKEEAALKPMVYCDFGCGNHGHAGDDLSEPCGCESASAPGAFKVHGRWCNFKLQVKGWRVCLAAAVMLEPLEDQVRTDLSTRVQKRCLSKEPLQAPEKPQFRRDFQRPSQAPDWEIRMGIPSEDQASTPGKAAKLRFLREHQAQKYNVHAPASVIRRSEEVAESRAVEFVCPTGSLSLGRVHPKARDRTNARDVWSKHGHIVDYTRLH